MKACRSLLRFEYGFYNWRQTLQKIAEKLTDLYVEQWAHHESASSSGVRASGRCMELMGSIPVEDSDFSLSHARDILILIHSFLISYPSIKFTIFLYVPVKLKLHHPPEQPPRHLNFWRLARSNSLPSGQKSRSNAPPISTEIPQRQILSLIKHCSGFSERDLPLWHLQTSFKGEILSFKSVKPFKTEKLTVVLH